MKLPLYKVTYTWEGTTFVENVRAKGKDRAKEDIHLIHYATHSCKKGVNIVSCKLVKEVGND